MTKTSVLSDKNVPLIDEKISKKLKVKCEIFEGKIQTDQKSDAGRAELTAQFSS